MQAIQAWFYAVFVEQFDVWVMLGFAAQFLFMMRFMVQWIASERAGRSIVPVAFWFFSIGGGTLLFVYAIIRQDPVFIAGQGLGLFIYFRNIWLIFAEKRRKEQ
ncbi:MAG: lipid-A-disaccharide synthase N-terminal domain-containing protein [Rhizobiales bacterium]|nr:lipid-A-disaccharide synthase N-terminal domain-containing protein [Hyphomicrobiales bacterium]